MTTPPHTSTTPPDKAKPAAECRERTYRWEDPLTGAEAAQQLSGLEYLRAMARGELPPPPIGQTLGFWITDEQDVQEGRITFRLTPQEYHYNPIGSVHGGVYATVLDSALGCCIHSVLPAGVGYTTLDLAVKYLRPLKIGMEEVQAVGEVVSVSRRVATAEAKIVGPGGKIYATATTTCLILRPEGSRP